MSNEKFELLQKKPPKKEKISVNEQIQQKRATLSEYKVANNELINVLWDIEHKLCKKNISAEEKQTLMGEKETIDKTIDQENYSDKIEQLKQEIIDLEIATFGHSDLTSNSPPRF